MTKRDQKKDSSSGAKRRSTSKKKVQVQVRESPVSVGSLGDFERHLVFDHAVAPGDGTIRERFEALARMIRDRLTSRWLQTDEAYRRARAKHVYYLSMEFLLGRTLLHNIINLGLEGSVRKELKLGGGEDWTALLDAEPDAGLGNGGLGRLAACFLDSLATVGIPAIGYGLRYEYGIFRQGIQNGYQVEYPDHWLMRQDPWEVARPAEVVSVPLGCSFRLEAGTLRAIPDTPSHLLGVPYDRPVVGYGGRNINTLRLWSAQSPEFFDFGEFSSGDFVGAIVDRVVAETVTRVLYPDDSTVAGQALRFVQEYFLVCCSIGDLTARVRRNNEDWDELPERAAVQLNDTHPAMAVPELMRILLDEAKLEWDQAWAVTRRTLAYTNHTLLPEALEKWPVQFFEVVCPRLLQIAYEINQCFLESTRRRFPGDEDRIRRVSIVEESPTRQIRMANLAILGTHSTNGVAAIHSQLIRSQLVPDFAEIFPERFNNKTNGVTPRRWLLMANPALAKLITEAIGDGWITNLDQLRELIPFADDSSFRSAFRAAKQAAKSEFATWLKRATGSSVDPLSIFDSQIKRIHEYKRQLLNILHVVILYQRLLDDPNSDIFPRTFFFAGKAAPAYRLAKLIIKLINQVSSMIDAQPELRDRLRVVFVPNYGVTVAERMIPASEVSEQISTAGYEASGTSNMKFMMNGALTIGTRDGATIEMAEAAGEENFFLFGLSAEQVASGRRSYDPSWHYDNEPEIRRALDLIFSNQRCGAEPGIFEPIREMLLTRGDYFMHLADLTPYANAQAALNRLYHDQDGWDRKAILNVACSGKFSSDRTIAEYADEIWKAKPIAVG